MSGQHEKENKARISFTLCVYLHTALGKQVALHREIHSALIVLTAEAGLHGHGLAWWRRRQRAHARPHKELPVQPRLVLRQALW